MRKRSPWLTGGMTIGSIARNTRPVLGVGGWLSALEGRSGSRDRAVDGRPEPAETVCGRRGRSQRETGVSSTAGCSSIVWVEAILITSWRCHEIVLLQVRRGGG